MEIKKQDGPRGKIYDPLKTAHFLAYSIIISPPAFLLLIPSKTGIIANWSVLDGIGPRVSTNSTLCTKELQQSIASHRIADAVNDPIVINSINCGPTRRPPLGMRKHRQAISSTQRSTPLQEEDQSFTVHTPPMESDPPLTANSQDGMMSLLDRNMFGSFDHVPMALDDPDDTSSLNNQTFSPVSVSAPQQQQAQQAQQAQQQQSQQQGENAALSDAAQAQNPDDASINIPGAGPPPASAFNSSQQANTTTTNTLTEFTKRRNWPAKVVEELKDLYQILDANGRVKYVSPSLTTLTGYAPEDLLDKFLKHMLHPDDVGLFVSELNESIATGNPLRLFYRFRKHDNTYAMFEAVGHGHIANAKFAPNPENKSPFCQAVLMVARPYPTKNAGLLDSFLEHKIENERLQRRIAELKREEVEEEEAQNSWLASQEGKSDIQTEDTMATSSTGTLFHKARNDASMMPPPERPASLNVALTQENLEGAISRSKPDSIKDKMARYQGRNHTDTIEMLTGLKYVEGERSRGITTGNKSPTLIKGDVGIAIPMDRDPRTGEKKKKLKLAEEYVCTDCGTLDSPEWRKGPSGPKTLCNACGLRWAKKEKKRNASVSNHH
ncbi:hypothetical protein MKZ38_007878 [Zalerion maritima]|uniref:Uncharacterized protein n=1 Tax=Zalerion maritima TaxID=339359 RepID=A0AAD5RVQ8_9PEZI|nr:hypothetical protein MKZ38_007878 [Zalerion maritima]